MSSGVVWSYVLIAFVAGIAVGFLLAVRFKMSVSVLPSGAGAGKRLLMTEKIHMMEVKCVCGSLLKFRDPVEPGYQP